MNVIILTFISGTNETSATRILFPLKHKSLSIRAKNSAAIHQSNTQGTIIQEDGKNIRYISKQIEGKTVRVMADEEPQGEATKLTAENQNPHTAQFAVALYYPLHEWLLMAF